MSFLIVKSQMLLLDIKGLDNDCDIIVISNVSD